MQCVLHIGTTKTGSSHIQAYLRLNRKNLANQGVLVPTSLGTRDHFWLSLLATDSVTFGKNSDLCSYGKVKDFNDLIAKKPKIVDRLADEIRRDGGKCKLAILTDEHLHSRIDNVSQINDLANFLRPLFNDVRIVIYVRPPAEHLLSLYSTALRLGVRVNVNRYFKRWTKRGLTSYFNHNKRISEWESVFGAENINVVSYSSEKKLEFGVVSHLSNFLGIDVNKLKITPASNTSINKYGQSVLLFYNRLGINIGRKKVISFCEHFFSGPSKLPALNLARKFEDIYRLENKILCDKYFSGNHSLMCTRWIPEKERKNEF